MTEDWELDPCPWCSLEDEVVDFIETHEDFDWDAAFEIVVCHQEPNGERHV